MPLSHDRRKLEGCKGIPTKASGKLTEGHEFQGIFIRVSSENVQEVSGCFQRISRVFSGHFYAVFRVFSDWF